MPHTQETETQARQRLGVPVIPDAKFGTTHNEYVLSLVKGMLSKGIKPSDRPVTPQPAGIHHSAVDRKINSAAGAPPRPLDRHEKASMKAPAKAGYRQVRNAHDEKMRNLKFKLYRQLNMFLRNKRWATPAERMLAELGVMHAERREAKRQAKTFAPPDRTADEWIADCKLHDEYLEYTLYMYAREPKTWTSDEQAGATVEASVWASTASDSVERMRRDEGGSLEDRNKPRAGGKALRPTGTILNEGGIHTNGRKWVKSTHTSIDAMPATFASFHAKMHEGYVWLARK